MIDLVKSIFNKKQKSIELPDCIEIKESGESLIETITEIAETVYTNGHMFMRKYLLPVVNLRNLILAKDFRKYIAATNQRKYARSRLADALERELTSQEGYISLLLSLWYPYISTEIKNQYDTTKFFRIQTYHIAQLITLLLQQIYQEQQNNNEKGIMKSELFRLRVLDAITDNYEFKKVKSVFVNKFKFGLGVNGEFTNSQIQLTTKEFDDLVMFKQIPVPFHQSIGLTLQFYEEYRLKAKIILMVKVVEKAKQEIIQYRTFYGLSSTVLGSDQIMPVMNYICEKTGKNIYASAQYLRALLGGGNVYNDELCRESINEVNKSANYCLDLIESVSSIYCHASRMGV